MAEPLGALAKVAALAHLRSQRGAGAVAAEQGAERVRERFAVAAAGDGACAEIDRFQYAVEVQDGTCGSGGAAQGAVGFHPAASPDHLVVLPPITLHMRLCARATPPESAHLHIGHRSSRTI